ncbi:MAG TPA: metal-dependent transcriptional regulator [Clostridia bacterium]|nr:metal-dependent transcriptional regulator [Clostridia bacterium]HOL60924.1 metal-dependent transcriptional regulator [Clostridia bacterium]HPO53570.1 metal-dependent transcriptional regulator [Clostridia bacterium]
MKETLERYLQTIYSLGSNGQAVKSVDVSRALGVSRPDVFRALKTLKLCGYIEQKPYGKIVLTSKGSCKAEQMLKVHKIISDFFVKEIGLTRADAEANAYKIEHILSDTAINKIIELYIDK